MNEEDVRPWDCVVAEGHEYLLDRPPIMLPTGGMIEDKPCHIQQWESRQGKWELFASHVCDVHHHIIIWPEAMLRYKMHEG